MQHEWVPSNLGHGTRMCAKCGATSEELAVLDELDHCKGLGTPTGDVKGYPPLRFTYKNWRGEVRVREATPCGEPWFGSTEWHPKRQWLLPMIDAEDGERKDFAMNDMAMYGNVVGVPGVV